MSLLLLLGGGGEAPTQAGFISMLSFWMGGAGATITASVTVSPRPILRMRMGLGR